MFNHIRLCYDVIVFIRTTIKKRGIGMSDFNQNNDDEDIVHIPFEEDIFLETHVFWQAGRYVSSSLKSFMSYISKVDFGSDTGLTVIQRECHA